MSKTATKTKPPPQRPREFAFSRVAGVSLGEYAAVSSMAVWALVVSVFGAAAMFSPWGLAVPAVSLVMALLAVYYIVTSAETLTGRKIALAAVAVSLTFAVVGGSLHLLRWRQHQKDLAEVRTLARQAADAFVAGRWDDAYAQFSRHARGDIPPGYWTYQWSRFVDVRGRIVRAELAERSRFFKLPYTGKDDLVTVTVKLFVDRPLEMDLWTRTVPDSVHVRLIYRRHYGDDRDVSPSDEGQPERQVCAYDVGWRLDAAPNFISPLPMTYREPLVWPAPGERQLVVRSPDGTARRLPLEMNAEPVLPPNVSGVVVGVELVPPLIPQSRIPVHQWLRRREFSPSRMGR